MKVPAASVRWEEPDGWSIRPLRVSRTSPAAGGLARFLDPGRVEAFAAYEAVPRDPAAAHRAPALELSVRAEGDEAYLVAARLPSGALAFHTARAEERPARRARGGATFRFTVPISALRPARRGVERRVRVHLLKVLAHLVDPRLPRLAATWEEARWRDGPRREGWVQVTRKGLLAGRLPRAELSSLPPAPARSLLLVHGIFSDAESAFRDLALARGTSGKDLLDLLAPVYGERIFAFNHRTVGTLPDENARALLEALPDRPSHFDAVTHSRGGVVLRTLAELSPAPARLARRFVLGRAVLAAAPNGGSALASPARWEAAVGWIANLVELFGERPFATGTSFVSEALVWMTRRATGAIPGIAALAPESPLVQALGKTGGEARYAALAANFHPDGPLALRLLDAGSDLFFSSANDLVVPTEGGWRLGSSTARHIGCFGPGGNLDGTAPMHHLNLFGRAETVDFLSRALLDTPHALRPLDPAADLPRRGDARAGAANGDGAPRRSSPRRGPRSKTPKAPASGTTSRRPAARAASTRRRPSSIATEPFSLTLIGTPSGAHLLASHGGARVLSEVPTRGGAAGKRISRVIALHEEILSALEGRSARGLPEPARLLELGALLFETLFPPDVRRLFDAARGRARGRLDVVFTSTVDWIADKPWEFAYDASRRAFLAIEDGCFVRNVFTPEPAEPTGSRRGPLRLLIASAQPAGTDPLTAREEESAIRAAFRPLVDEGLAQVDFLRPAGVDALHRRLSTHRYDVLHFIGHGAFDERRGTGVLLFEEKGGARELDAASLKQLLLGKGLKLVFLNACETGRGGRAEFNRGVAPALVAGGLPAVVANQYKVLDASATAFARHFYWQLASGAAIGDAAREARVSVSVSAEREAIDWAVPVVFARDPRAVPCPAARPARARKRA